MVSITDYNYCIRFSMIEDTYRIYDSDHKFVCFAENLDECLEKIRKKHFNNELETLTLKESMVVKVKHNAASS